MLKKNRKIREKYYYKHSYLERSLKTDILENDIAYIPCRVSGIEDIISRFSVKDYESLDESFMSYVVNYTEFIPVDYPVVLEITGPAFSPEEKKIITESIDAEMDYHLGKVEGGYRRRKKIFLYMLGGTFFSGVLLSAAIKFLNYNVPREFVYVLFWLFADAVVRYVFIEQGELKEEKIQAGRLASMKVEFVEEAGA